VAGIREIAKLCGVSIGTVDRVLHNRGRYSEKTREKVLHAAKVLQYKPNLTARGLRRNKPSKIALLHALPDQDQGFWKLMRSGLLQAQDEFGPFNVEIESICFDRYSTHSFNEAAQQVVDKKVDGVVLAPLLTEQTSIFIKNHPQLPVVCFDCPLPQAAVVQSLYQDGLSGGKTVAGICMMRLEQSDPIAVVGYESYTDHISRRVKGFAGQLQKHGYPEPDYYSIPDELDTYELKVYLDKNEIDLSRYAALFIAKTGAHKYARIVNSTRHTTFLIGYDLVEENIQQLRNGAIDILISQNSTQQVYQGLRTMVNYLIYGRKSEKSRIAMPIDILTAHNIDSYIQYNHLDTNPLS